MSETNRNDEAQSTDGDTETEHVSEEASDEEQQFQQELEKQVAEENYYNEMLENSTGEGADNDEYVMYGESRGELGPGFVFPFLGPSVVEVTFDEDQQKFVAVT